MPYWLKIYKAYNISLYYKCCRYIRGLSSKKYVRGIARSLSLFIASTMFLSRPEIIIYIILVLGTTRGALPIY
jgi:hypothetical protein